MNKDTRREYWDTVKAIVDSALTEYTTLTPEEAISEQVDGSYWVIYTHAAYKVREYTNNWDAIDDYGPEFMGADSVDAVVCRAAYCAMERDCMELLSDRKPDATETEET